MSLDRQTLREELVAIIAAGRELSPDHDHELADMYVDMLHQRRFIQSPKPRPGFLDDPQSVRTLLTGLGATLAALVLAFLLFAGSHLSYVRHDDYFRDFGNGPNNVQVTPYGGQFNNDGGVQPIPQAQH